MTLAYFIILSICFAVSLSASINKHSSRYIRFFTILMLVTTITEIGNYFYIFPVIHQSNHWTYNIETVFEFYFFSYFFYNILKRPFRRIIKVFVFVYPFILLLSFLTVQKYYTFHTYTYIFGELYLIVLCLLYYRELYTAAEFKKLSTLPEFWIVTGLLIFTAGELPYMILLNYLNKHYVITSLYFSQYILGTLNIVMYAMFTIGLIWSTKIQK